MENKTQLTHVDYPVALLKAGYTETPNVVNRFTTWYHTKFNFADKCLGEDYNVKAEWSAWMTKEEAADFESMYATLVGPKDFWCKEKYSGITECRLFDETLRKTLIKTFYGKYQKREQAEGLVKGYLVTLTKK